MNITSHGRGTQSSQILTVLVGITFGVTISLTLVGIMLFYDNTDIDTFGLRLIIAGLSSIIVFSSHRLLNSLQDKRIFLLLPSLSVRWLVVFTLVLLSAYVDKSADRLSRAVMLTWLLLTPVSLLLTALAIRLFAALFYSNPARRRKAVLIWSNSACADLVESLRNTPLAAIDVVGFFDNRTESRPPSNLPRLGDLNDVTEWLVDPITGELAVEVVFIGLNMREPPELAEIIAILQDSTVSTYFVPESLIFGMPGIQLREMAGKPVLASTETPFIGLAALPKRLLDLFGATLGLILLSPLFLIIAIGVKLSSPGPVLFKQKRYGVAGKPINIYKFRSMINHNSKGPVIQATVGDNRVTRFGRFIRRTSIDELPQLLNVIQGNMSLVGPRPHAVEHNELYRKLVDGYMLRHKIKPGITGWAQVNGFRGETETLEKMQSRVDYDLYYIQHWSVWLDIVIMWRTVSVLFGDKNAY
ncbi:undecaprenyl-phosphate glucose phosphotransferase [Undibacterium sp. 10I3]|nr:undecaprenyl-phosphate glucose phosphotransferase [Undibacterium sp. 10I3]MEB0259590.1 undecaprenyl-phosphate glucose phosphotransferase [Undibacterium sp. 5I1]